MPERNRVTPLGEIVAIEQRGLFMGNRGSIHRGHEIVRPWQVRRWITCALEHKGWVAPKWEPGRWTPLFFYDEAVALAAGHRPCALCRRADFDAWMDAWEAAFAPRLTVDPIDRRLHHERLDGRSKRTHEIAWRDLPVGAFALDRGEPVLVMEDRIVLWTRSGYGDLRDRPAKGPAEVLTPPSIVGVLAHGYEPVLHHTAG